MTLDELKAQKIWFPWRYALGKNGKMTKVPMSAAGGVTGTSDNFCDTWVDYKATVTAKDEHNASGIGFKIPDDMYFLDIDGRPFNDSFVQLLLERHDTYAEISPSGNVIHILGICDNDRLPFIMDESKGRITIAREFYQKNPNNHTELYFGHVTNRYATFTGNALNGKELRDFVRETPPPFLKKYSSRDFPSPLGGTTAFMYQRQSRNKYKGTGCAVCLSEGGAYGT